MVFSTSFASALYAKRFGNHCKAEQFCFGQMIDFIPTPGRDREKDGLRPAGESKDLASTRTVPGLFLGWHVHPGGKWSGDYICVSFEKLRHNVDAGPSETRIHRTKNVIELAHQVGVYPLYEVRLATETQTGSQSAETRQNETPVASLCLPSQVVLGRTENPDAAASWF